MNIAIVGFATEGRVSYGYFSKRGDSVTVCDADETISLDDEIQSQLGKTYLENLDRFDVIVRSAGIHPGVILEKNPTVTAKITTAVNEFLRICPTRNVIGVTGTKGKGTTSTLITKMLEAAGKNVSLGGNIGRSPLEFVNDIRADDWVVLELSSFQLHDIAHSPHIATCLMVVPEHLNWHKDMVDYTTAKTRLFMHQKSDDVAIYYAENKISKDIVSHGSGQKIPYYAPPGACVESNAITISGRQICKTNELKLLGAHNWQNACAAVTTVWQALQPATPQEIDAVIAAARDVLITFAGLPHRIELVRNSNGITYYNDSFATGLHATLAAIQAIPEQKVLVVGGFDRMLPLDYFCKYIAEHEAAFRTILVIGQSGPRLAKALDQAGAKRIVLDTKSTTMPEIVAAATALAKPGDAVLLSPGFASYDMFKNFEERGDQYKKAVAEL
ncbi:UDP-N-acetylmuramoyl-L-alanine--D-glutamate ligase [Candidatus Saccharibacteria bacterium]|nr:MAG: UDP-N-acetylmuramoyl-L-alanine--D-glutamate ligase [Candidatus Saccharibacteria bacterium]